MQAFLFRWGQGRGLWALRCAEPLDLLILLGKRARALASALLVDVDVDLHSSTMQCMSWLLAHRLLVPGSFVRYDDWRASWQQYGEGKAHRELTLRHNITWRCLSGTKEWEVLAIGSYAPRPPDPRDKLVCDVKPGSLCRVEHRRGGRRAPRSSE